MTAVVDLRVLELLTSRLCHDLVGPIGAVNNGLEIVGDDSLSSMRAEVMGLAAHSAQQAVSTLRFYRLAYGTAGNRVGSDFAALKELILNYIAHGKCEFVWSFVDVPHGFPDDAGKLLLNLVELARESLPRGGKITTHFGQSPDAGLFMALTAAGDRAGIRDEVRLSLSDDATINDLTPRNVHGFFTRQLVKRMGTDLLLNEAVESHIQYVVAFPSTRDEPSQG